MLGLGLGLQKSTRVGGFIGLLDLFPNAAAAYSLRKLRAAYSGSAVRVRRSSDNTEQDIGFTTQGELDTTSLLSFVNEDVDVYTSDFISSIDGWGNNNMTLSSNQTIGGSSGWLECEATTDSGILKRAKAPISLEAGCTYTIQSKVYVESGNNVGGLYIGADGNGLLVSTTDTDEVVELSVTFTATTGGDLEWFMTDSSLNPYFTGGLGKSIYIKDTIITQTTADGHVKTWYDQSGNSNDATQGTPTAQPKIVSGGAVITEGASAKPAIVGASGDYFIYPFSLASSVDYYSFNVIKNNPTLIGSLLFGSENASDYTLLSQTGSSSTAISNNSTINDIFIDGNSYTLTTRGDLYNQLVSQSLVTLDTTSSFVGALPRNVYQGGTTFGMYISQELIIYPSDQSANRTAIESNQATFYGITLP